MVAPLSRPLLRVPRASSSRLPAAAQRRLFSSSRPSLAETEQPSSASSAEQASSSPSAAPTADKPAPFVWTPSLQWAFDTTKPVGKLFNAAGTKAVKNYHSHLLSSINAAAASLSARATTEIDAKLRGLPRQTVLDLVKTTSAPLPMFKGRKLLAETSSEEEVRQQEAIRESHRRADALNPVRARTVQPEWDGLFANACEALNHNFFLSSLRNPADEGSYPLQIEEHLVASFGSNSGFEQTMLGYAEGMSSGGWLWLVQERNGGAEDLAVVATYGPGTLLVCGGKAIRGETAQSLRLLGLSDQGHVFEEEQSRDVAGNAAAAAPFSLRGQRAFSSSARSAAEDAGSSPSSSSPTFGLNARQPVSTLFGARQPQSGGGGRPTNLLTVENELVPLACLSMHEHAFVPTHGVWGKRAYVQAWLSALDWEKVERRMVEGNARAASSRYF